MRATDIALENNRFSVLKKQRGAGKKGRRSRLRKNGGTAAYVGEKP